MSGNTLWVMDLLDSMWTFAQHHAAGPSAAAAAATAFSCASIATAIRSCVSVGCHIMMQRTNDWLAEMATERWDPQTRSKALWRAADQGLGPWIVRQLGQAMFSFDDVLRGSSSDTEVLHDSDFNTKALHGIVMRFVSNDPSFGDRSQAAYNYGCALPDVWSPEHMNQFVPHRRFVGGVLGAIAECCRAPMPQCVRVFKRTISVALFATPVPAAGAAEPRAVKARLRLHQSAPSSDSVSLALLRAVVLGMAHMFARERVPSPLLQSAFVSTFADSLDRLLRVPGIEQPYTEELDERAADLEDFMMSCDDIGERFERATARIKGFLEAGKADLCVGVAVVDCRLVLCASSEDADKLHGLLSAASVLWNARPASERGGFSACVETGVDEAHAAFLLNSRKVVSLLRFSDRDSLARRADAKTAGNATAAVAPSAVAPSAVAPSAVAPSAVTPPDGTAAAPIGPPAVRTSLPALDMSVENAWAHAYANELDQQVVAHERHRQEPSALYLAFTYHHSQFKNSPSKEVKESGHDSTRFRTLLTPKAADKQRVVCHNRNAIAAATEAASEAAGVMLNIRQVVDAATAPVLRPVVSQLAAAYETDLNVVARHTFNFGTLVSHLNRLWAIRDDDDEPSEVKCVKAALCDAHGLWYTRFAVANNGLPPICVEATLSSRAWGASCVYSFRPGGNVPSTTYRISPAATTAPAAAAEAVDRKENGFVSGLREWHGFTFAKPCKSRCQSYGLSYALLRALLRMRRGGHPYAPPRASFFASQQPQSTGADD